MIEQSIDVKRKKIDKRAVLALVFFLIGLMAGGVGGMQYAVSSMNEVFNGADVFIDLNESLLAERIAEAAECSNGRGVVNGP